MKPFCLASSQIIVPFINIFPVMAAIELIRIPTVALLLLLYHGITTINLAIFNLHTCQQQLNIVSLYAFIRLFNKLYILLL